MRRAGALLALALAALPAGAQERAPFRWTSGYGQGTLEAMIRGPGDSSIAFACPGARPDRAPSLSVQVRGAVPRGAAMLQIAVDGRRVPVALQDGFASGAGPGSAREVVRAADALVASRARSFIAEIPEISWRQEFSLRGIREALGTRPGRTILADCRR